MQKGFLESLGIFGLSPIEDALLAGLVTKDPILLIGGHGSAKTLLARRLAEALGLSFHAYDASKALFEDVIGFPNPESLKTGIVDYASTPISIWGKQFILVDELSRATPQMQNKWLEVIRSRQVMGKRIEGLTYIVAAMNPPGYLGSIPLDAALAGRFAFVIVVPEAKDMNLEDIHSIIRHVSKDDAPGITNERFKLSLKTAQELKNFLENARTRYVQIAEQYKEECVNYIVNLKTSFKLQGYPLDGRRLGMLRRNLIAYLAVKAEKKGNIDYEKLDEYFFECIKSSMPYEAQGEKLPIEILRLAHHTAMKLLGKSKESYEKRIKVFLAENKVEMVEKFIHYFGELSESDHQDLLSHLEDVLYNSNQIYEILDALKGLKKLVFACQKGVINPQRDVIRRAMTIFGKLQFLNKWTIENLFEIYKDENVEEYGYQIPQIRYDASNDLFAIRLALNLNLGKDQHRRLGDNIKKIVKDFEVIRNILKTEEVTR